jgi:8-hydroxy-5-deazaflavin:NADPH oxidoreductase
MKRVPPRIGILGAGHVGPVIARLAIAAGSPVAIATSGDPGDLALITGLVIPGAEPRWAVDAVADADIVVLAIPLHRFLDMDPRPLAGKLVIDAMNYWPATDGHLALLDHEGMGKGIGSSEVVAQRLYDASVVKTLNHVGYHELESHARPTGSVDRRAVGVAGDDHDSVARAATFVNRLGYDPVLLGPLSAGRVLQPGAPAFGAVLGPEDFRRAVREATRTSEAFRADDHLYRKGA